MGLQFHIQTDHKPLVPLFSSKDLDELPLRVQQFRLRMMRFLYTISHVPGKEIAIADALSCTPVAATLETTNTLESETAAYVDFIVKNLPASEQ